MALPAAHPVFYDTHGQRSVYSRRAVFSISAFLITLFIILIGSAIIHPSIPLLPLGKPKIAVRGAPNVPNSSIIPRAAQPFDVSGFNAFVAQQKPIMNQGMSDSTRARAYGFYVNWDDNSFTSLKQNIDKLDVLVPEWLHLATDGGDMALDDEVRQNETLDYVRATRPELPIMPLINNFDNTTQDWNNDRLSKVLMSQEARQKLIGSVVAYLNQNKFQGVSIDFENIPIERQGDLVQFMSELYARLHPLGLEISQNIPLEDPDFDVKTLAHYSDFLILMAYDEHSIYDSVAGPVASQGWYTKALAQRFGQLPPNKYIVALGSYGYDWTGNQATGEETTFQDAVRTAKESEGKILLDKKSLNPTFDYYDDANARHHVWYLDAVSVFDEIVAAQKLGGPAGYALWRLGSEDPSTWNVISGRQNLNQNVAQSLQIVRYGYDVDYEGDGEILRVTAAPADGKRTVEYEATSGFIVGENVTDYPSAYVITRWGGGDKKKIALTFDDGPDATYTPKILDVLKQYNVPATFFVVGANANAHPDILLKTFNQGEEIGNHTFTHPNVTAISDRQFQVELGATERLFEGILGHKSLFFRPPYAEDIEPVTPDQVAPLQLVNTLGYYTVGMHIDPSDWSSPGADTIVTRVVDGAVAGNGNVVLLHDGGGNRNQTVAALPKIIEALQAQGFQFVLISDLLGVSHDMVMPQVSAREQWLARFNGAGFWVVTGFDHFLLFMFILGIVVGIARFIFIGTLAVAQWAYAHFGKYRRFIRDFQPRVVVLIPAYNESAVVVRTVGAILASTYPDVRIVVIDDGSTDDTFARLSVAFSENPQVKLFTQANHGKAQALNFGITQTGEQDEIIVTLDADTVFLPDTITKLVRRFVDRRVAAVAGNAKVGNRINILTRWQALEYITSQNLDRRAFETLNCIAVVPGSVGAWRRTALVEAGGFSSDTLAEDADLTFTLLRSGYRVAFDDEAFAYTEAPDTVRNFIKQRFRWMFGTLQAAWKHRDTLFRPRYGFLGFFAVPNVFVFQVFFPLISPLMDLTLVLSVMWVGWQKYQHPIDFDASHTLQGMFSYYVLFLVIDMLTAMLPFFLERKEQWNLLLWLPLQRFFYRQLMYYVAIKAIGAAIKGRMARWGKQDRKATVATSV